MVSLPWGSSPRVRGTPLLSFPGTLRPGIIPACAGNTVCCHSLFGSWWDHPRVCGEHPVREITVSFAMGSSPRVRGTRHAQRADGHGVGIIPACAGNTRRSRIRRKDSRDHPRVCREHVMDVGDSTVEPGSSPRVRGTLPARHQSKGGKRDHPRVCGEHRFPSVMDALRPWIIPACAGNTQVLAQPKSRSRDHPRVCGEHRQSLLAFRWVWGSSPRVRGTLGWFQ